jgi:hypothetical protein
MGTWFPDYRTGTPGQCAAYRDAKYDLNRNGRYEDAAGIRSETGRFLDLNDRVAAAERPLHPVQRCWHFRQASAREDRDFARLQQASDRQDRAMRRGSR